MIGHERCASVTESAGVDRAIWWIDDSVDVIFRRVVRDVTKRAGGNRITCDVLNSTDVIISHGGHELADGRCHSGYKFEAQGKTVD